MNIYLSGRIDSNNAAEIESDISRQLAETHGEIPIFDAEKLEYISSAGLRVLLKFRKNFNTKLDVLNVSDDVYSIFDVTGFTELFNVRKKLREISVEGHEVIGEGHFSKVYRLDPETVVKVFTHPTATLESAESDRKTSREVFLHDIPTAIAYDVVKVGERYGLVYEMINADTVSGTLTKQPERLEELSLKMSRLMKKLHTTEFEPGTFRDARETLHSKLDRPYSMGMINSEDKTSIDELIDRIPYRNTFVHFDFHPKNVMLNDNDLILIDVGGAGLGHPIADLMFSYSHLVSLARITSEDCIPGHKEAIGLDADTLGVMWNVIAAEYFGTTDSDTLKHYDEIIRDYSLMLLPHFISIGENSKNKLAFEIAAKAIESLRKVIGSLKPIDSI